MNKPTQLKPELPNPIDVLSKAMDDSGVQGEMRAHLVGFFANHWNAAIAADRNKADDGRTMPKDMSEAKRMIMQLRGALEDARTDWNKREWDPAAAAPALTANERTTEFQQGYQTGIEMGKALAADEASAPVTCGLYNVSADRSKQEGAEQFNSEVLGRVTTYLSQFDEFQPSGENSADQAFKNIVDCIEKLRTSADQNDRKYTQADMERFAKHCMDARDERLAADRKREGAHTSASAGGRGDAIARSKRILALVDDYHEKPTTDTRTALRVALMDEFEAGTPTAAPVSAGLSDEEKSNLQELIRYLEAVDAHAQADTVRALESRLSLAAQKDAERYRVLRDSKYQRQEDDPCVTDDSFNTFFEEDLDKAVDALKARYDAMTVAAPLPNGEIERKTEGE